MTTEIEPNDEPTDEQLRSEEAKRYRLERNEIRDAKAEVEQQLVEAHARAEEAERLAVNAHLRGFADPVDFWSQTDLAELRGEAGTVDLDAVQAHADELLAAHPHWRANTGPGAASAHGVNASGLIGYRPRSVLDTENAEAGPAVPLVRPIPLRRDQRQMRAIRGYSEGSPSGTNASKARGLRREIIYRSTSRWCRRWTRWDSSFTAVSPGGSISCA